MRTFSKKFLLPALSIIQAPMAGGITTPELVAAVSNANAIGSFATGYLKTEQVKNALTKIKKLTNKPFAVNVFVPNDKKILQDPKQIANYQLALNKFRHDLGMNEERASTSLKLENNFHEIIDFLLHEKIKIVSFTFGNLPFDVIRAFKSNGTYLMGTATSLAEAKILADCEIDAIIAQGYEAGGHRGSFFTPFKRACIGTMAFVPLLVNNIDRPIIASGGIMDGQGIVAALSLGACAVQMGTAFLSTKESGAPKAYKQRLIGTKNNDEDLTTITNAYSGKKARGLHTAFIEYMETELDSIPAYPIANMLSSPVRKEAIKQEITDLYSMWCGQGVPLITDGLTVDELLVKLRSEVKETLQDLSTITL